MYKTLSSNNLFGGNNYNNELFLLTNPKWPPSIGSKIKFKDPTDNIWYSGLHINTIWNSTACVIKLEPPHLFNDNALIDFPEYDSGKNHYVLLPSYNWQYILQNNINHPNPILTKNITYPTQYNYNVDLVPSFQNQNQNQNLPYITQNSSIISDNNIHNKFNKFKSNLHSITPIMLKDANNPYYKPLMTNDNIDLFDNLFGDTIGTKTIHLPSEQQQLLLEKLKNFEVILPNDVFLPVNKNIAIHNIITDPEDEINEGNRMQKYINQMVGNIFKDILIKIHAGYLYIVKKGTIINDVVTKKLVPSLKYFSWQEGKPIDYHTLKYVIFQNQFQKSLEENKLQKSEAESILGIEYIIALQCKSEYQLWCLKRLLMIWHSDSNTFNIIRKIKLLINHYRADPGQQYNQNNGILPMIAIYPRYGIDNARLLLSKLEYYFSLYIEDNINNTYPNIFFENSNPTYFLKKNNLLYYTNGSIDLKMYIKESIQFHNTSTNDSLTVDMAKIHLSKDIIVN